MINFYSFAFQGIIYHCVNVFIPVCTNNFLDFYITDEERNFKTLADKVLQVFIKRINDLIYKSFKIHSPKLGIQFFSGC